MPGQMTEECVVVAWHKQEGDAVHKGDVIFEIETDKSVMDVESFDDERTIKWCPLTYANAYALMGVLQNLKPVPLGLQTSAGTGDRLGLATPGHARAFPGCNSQATSPPRSILPE